MTEYRVCYVSPVGAFSVCERNGKICGLHPASEAEMNLCEFTPLLRRMVILLDDYFSGCPVDFSSVPLELSASDFRIRVWNELRKIPFGEVRTYGQIAAILGNSNAARAVGGACHANPVMIVVPCHRVIGAGGALSGFAFGKEMKRRLLNLEKFRRE